MKEELILNVEMLPLFDAAIARVSMRTRISNTSINFAVNKDRLILTVNPTHITYLYDLFFEVGRLYERAENSKIEKE